MIATVRRESSPSDSERDRGRRNFPSKEYQRAGQQPSEFIVFKEFIVFLLRCKTPFHFEARDFIGWGDQCLLFLLPRYVSACNKTQAVRTGILPSNSLAT